jgi:hypothetical protein
MLEAQIVDLPQVSLMARLILSARSLPMDAIRQRDLDVIHADQCIEAFKESVHDLAKCFENLTMRGVLIDDFQFIEGPKESLLGLVKSCNRQESGRSPRTRSTPRYDVEFLFSMPAEAAE